MLTEKGVEVTATGETAHLRDKADGLVGVSQQLGGMADTPVIEIFAEAYVASTFTDGISHITGVDAR